jgi:hypothetical protein
MASTPATQALTKVASPAQRSARALHGANAMPSDIAVSVSGVVGRR